MSDNAESHDGGSRDVENVEVIDEFNFLCTDVKLEYEKNRNGVMEIERVRFKAPGLESGRVTFKIRDRYEREFTDEDGFDATEEVVERYERKNKPELLKSLKSALDSDGAVKITCKVTKLVNTEGDVYHLIREYHKPSITIESCTDEELEAAKDLETVSDREVSEVDGKQLY